MKGINKILAISLIALVSACSSTHHTAVAPDDVYYSKSDAQEYPQAAKSHPSPTNRGSGNSSTDQSQDSQYQDNSQDYYRGSDSSAVSPQTQNANTPDNYYNSDHYDYAYSARLRRYYAPVYGYGYYDPYYTNSYWYDYNPYSYGTSIYLGYNFWGPSVSIGFGWGYGSGWGVGYGYPYYPYGGYGYPYYGYPYYGYPYYGYGNPYCGYHNPYYYNSYDANSSYYYGPRTSGSSTGRNTTGRTGAAPPRTLGEKYQQAVAENRISPSNNTGGGRNSNSISSGRKELTATPLAPSTRTGNTGESGGTNPGIPARNPVLQEQKATMTNEGGNTGRTNVGTGIISEKNQKGGTRVLTSAPLHDNKIAPGTGSENNTGGTVRPNSAPVQRSQPAPSRTNAQPKNNNLLALPYNNGGTTQPNHGRQEENKSRTTPRTNDSQRNPSVTPGNFDLPKRERNSERTRQYQQSQQSQPKFEQRIFKQETPQPRQQQNYNQPQPQRNNSTPSAPSNGRSGGRR